MSIENGFNKIKRLAGIKKCLIIEGNVQDVYLHNKKILTLTEILTNILKELNQEVFYWDRISGLSGDVTQIELTDSTELNGDTYQIDEEDDDESNPQLSPDEIMRVVYRNLTNKNLQTSFILNYSEYIFDKTNTQDNDKINLTLLQKALKEREINYYKDEVNESTVILIVNKSSEIPLNFLQNNPEVEIITLTKPDRNERKEIIERTKSCFNIKYKGDSDDLLDQENIECVDMLEDFTNREIIQLCRLSQKEEKMSFEKLFYLFKYGEKENPWEKLEHSRLLKISEELASRVVGQDEAIEKIKKAIIKAYMGLSGLHKASSRSTPKGIFFFVGPTGVGKTELSKSLAKFLFGDEDACIRFDMSEYAQENSDQKLIGAPPGYVGYEEGGQLTNLVKEQPFSVILFDEIEKAAKPNPRILDIFLQILEDGRLTDSKGETVYFNDTIIIFTSNLGASEVEMLEDNEAVGKEFIRIVKNYFDNELKRPELLGRIGYNNIVPFNFIKDEEFQIKICKSKLKPIVNGIKEKYNLKLEFEDDVKAIRHILKGVDRKKGGRDILNNINDRLLDPLAMFLFSKKEDLRILRGSNIIAKIVDDEFQFSFD